MTSVGKSDKWLLVEWTAGGRGVINVRAVDRQESKEDLKIGGVVTLTKHDNNNGTGIILSSSSSRQQLEQQKIDHKEIKKENEKAGPSTEPIDEEDFSASGSSWEPTDDSASDTDESDMDDLKMKNMPFMTIKLPPIYKKPRKVLTPTNRVRAVIPNGMKHNKPTKSTNNKKRISPPPKKSFLNKAFPDSTKRKTPAAQCTRNANENKTNIPELEHIKRMKTSFTSLFQALNKIKGIHQDSMVIKTETLPNNNTEQTLPNDETLTENKENKICEYDFVPSDRSISEESNRSDDNILITNKYNKVEEKQPNQAEDQGQECQDNHEHQEDQERQHDQDWVPIGSGKTLIHKDQFRKVNWKSYTVATRTLLLAVFPRRVLATHSMTGKKSPAFRNKPAKMCLDPKKVTDVIIEITDRFDVKENLVRGIITTKCADECKMLRMKMKNKQKPAIQENVSVQEVRELPENVSQDLKQNITA